MRPKLSAMKTRMVVRLQIAAIQMLQRFVESGTFRIMLRAFIYVRLRYRLYGLLFTTPKSWGTASPQAAQQLRQIKALRNAPIQMVGHVPASMHTMTWGVPGFALIALIQIVTAQPAQINAARWVSSGCFALVIPWLAVLGYMLHGHMDSKQPLTLQECLNMHASMYAGNLLFCLGLASLLWSYNRSIAGVFVLSCYVAVRWFLSFAKKRASSALPPASAIIRLP